MSTFKITSNVSSFAAKLEATAEGLAGGNYAEARAAFKDMRDILMSGVRENVGSVGPALSHVTSEYKARVGFNSEVLNASGNFLAGLDGSYGSRFAKVSRGEREWYIFLHDRGRGFSNWTVDGTVRKAVVATRRRKPSGRPGVTRFPERRVFFISSATDTALLNRYHDFLLGRLRALAD